MVIEPGFYVGTLHHRRHEPRAHAFTYPVSMALLDVDRLPDLMSVSTLTGYNQWRWASFDDRDHLGDPRQPLRARVLADAAAHGLKPVDGPMFLLTNLRYGGYCFNPVSFYYLFDREWRLAHVMAEVHNTFGGAHNYWLTPEVTGRAHRAIASKAFYVSPFMPVDLDYWFSFTEPGERLNAHIDARRGERLLFDATLSLERRPWTAAEIRRQLLRFPASTLHVTAAIHWQAVRLWWKGASPVPRLTPNGEGERAAWQAALADTEPTGEARQEQR